MDRLAVELWREAGVQVLTKLRNSSDPDAAFLIGALERELEDLERSGFASETTPVGLMERLDGLNDASPAERTRVLRDVGAEEHRQVGPGGYRQGFREPAPSSEAALRALDDRSKAATDPAAKAAYDLLRVRVLDVPREFAASQAQRARQERDLEASQAAKSSELQHTMLQIGVAREVIAQAGASVPMPPQFSALAGNKLAFAKDSIGQPCLEDYRAATEVPDREGDRVEPLTRAKSYNGLASELKKAGRALEEVRARRQALSFGKGSSIQGHLTNFLSEAEGRLAPADKRTLFVEDVRQRETAFGPMMNRGRPKPTKLSRFEENIFQLSREISEIG